MGAKTGRRRFQPSVTRGSAEGAFHAVVAPRRKQCQDPRPGDVGVGRLCAAATRRPRRGCASNQAGAPASRATVSDLVDHIDYIVKRIGIDHVGIGTDFNHGSGIDGFNDESEAPNVTRELLRRGYSEAQIAKIWGGNFLRVFRRVGQVAKTLP